MHHNTSFPPVQSGALDLLKELRSVPMTLELLQVSLSFFSFFTCVFSRAIALDRTDAVFLNSPPELGCPSTPFASRAQTKK